MTRCNYRQLLIVLLGAVLAAGPALAGHIDVDFAKAVAVKQHGALCRSEAELEAFEKGATADCFRVAAGVPVNVIDTKPTGFMGGGPMNVQVRLVGIPTDMFVNAEDLANVEAK